MRVGVGVAVGCERMVARTDDATVAAISGVAEGDLLGWGVKVESGGGGSGPVTHAPRLTATIASRPILRIFMSLWIGKRT